MRVFYAVKMPENDRFVSYKHIHHVQLFILHKHFFDTTCIYINVGSCQNPVTVGKCFFRFYEGNPFLTLIIHWFSSVQAAAGPNINVLYYLEDHPS